MKTKNEISREIYGTPYASLPDDGVEQARIALEYGQQSGLCCEILENKRLGNCSAGGISETQQAVLLVMAEGGPVTIEAAQKDGVPVCRLVSRKLFAQEPAYLHAEPVDCMDKNTMFGGCYIVTSDSRFPCKHPIALHDRVE